MASHEYPWEFVPGTGSSLLSEGSLVSSTTSCSFAGEVGTYLGVRIHTSAYVPISATPVDWYTPLPIPKTQQLKIAEIELKKAILGPKRSRWSR